MKKWILCIFSLLMVFGAAQAQKYEEPTSPVVTYGYINYDSVFETMPEYDMAVQSFKELKAKYDREINYNETSFKRQFAEFLQGQKDFPENILLKRQRDMQNAMERNLAFRQDVDSLLSKAREEMFRPVHERLDKAIGAVGRAHGYLFIINLKDNNFPFVNRIMGRDVTNEVVEQVKIKNKN